MINNTTTKFNNMAAAYDNSIDSLGANVNGAIQAQEFAKQEKKSQALEQLKEQSRISFWNRVIFAPLKEGRKLSKLV
jgi:hypothetical protein